MRLKLDENLSQLLKPMLQQEGHDVETTADEKLTGRSDVEVAAAAKAEGRILFTLDLEFADLRKYPPGSHPGVILFRPRTMGPLTVNSFILQFVQETNLTELAQCVVVVDPNRVRVRHPPIDAGPSKWQDLPLE
jgi:predicted nuclease of predicted toxin-antitoxin system